MNGKEWWLLLLGIVASISIGILFPLIALVFSQVVDAYAAPADQVVDDVSLWAGLLMVISVAYACAAFVQVHYIIIISAMHITYYQYDQCF